MQVKFETGDLEGGKWLGEGTHDCVISNLEHKQSKGGAPMVEITFSDASGKTTRDWFMLEGKKFKLASLALAAGASKEDLLSGRFDTATLGHKTIKVIRKITGKEEYKGEMKDRYENDYAPSSHKLSESQDSELPF